MSSAPAPSQVFFIDDLGPRLEPSVLSGPIGSLAAHQVEFETFADIIEFVSSFRYLGSCLRGERGPQEDVTEDVS